MPSTRDLSVLGLDPETNALSSGRSAESLGQSPTAKFNLSLMDLLKRYQGLGTGKFASAELQGRQAQAGSVLAEATPGMPPNLQSQVRNAQAKSFEPTISGATEMKKTFSEQIAGLGDALSQAKAIGQLMQQEETTKRQEAIDMIYKFPSAVKALDDKSKKAVAQRAGVPIEFINQLPEEEPTKKDTQIVEANNRKYLIDSQTGEIIKDLGVSDIPSGGTSGTGAGAGATTTAGLSPLQNEALTSAKDLMDKFNKRQGTAIVGKSRWIANPFGTNLFVAPGTAASNLQTQFNNLKSLLSLEDVKYLKGQGQVSDAERRLLAEASTKLELTLDEPEFKKELQRIIDTMEKAQSGGQGSNQTSGQTSGGLKYQIIK